MGKKSVWTLCSGPSDPNHPVSPGNKMPIPLPTIHALMSLAGLSPAKDMDKVHSIDYTRWVADGKKPTTSYLDTMASAAQKDDLLFLILEGHGFCRGPNSTAGDAGILMADGNLMDGQLHDHLFSKLPKGCRLVCLFFACDSGGLPMNLVWNVRVEDEKCAKADVKQIEGDQNKVKADIICFTSSKGDQLTYAGDLLFPIEQVAKQPDVKKLGFCEFLARMQAQQKLKLQHKSIIEAYCSSHRVITMKVGQFMYSMPA